MQTAILGEEMDHRHEDGRSFMNGFLHLKRAGFPFSAKAAETVDGCEKIRSRA